MTQFSPYPGYDPMDGAEPGVMLSRDNPCRPRHQRPTEPKGTDNVWYRGWEVGYSSNAAYWSDEGWIAYKGGCDLDAQEVRAASYKACLDLIDDKEE